MQRPSLIPQNHKKDCALNLVEKNPGIEVFKDGKKSKKGINLFAQKRRRKISDSPEHDLLEKIKFEVINCLVKQMKRHFADTNYEYQMLSSRLQ